MDNAIDIHPYSIGNGKRLGGCTFVKAEKRTSPECDVFIFNNPYRRTNIDIVFLSGKLFISDWYGESMDRNKLMYVRLGG